MKNSLIILSFFSLGILLGYNNLLPAFLHAGSSTKYALYFLMFIVGISIGADKNSISIIKNFDFRLLLVPIATLIGTFSGVAVISLFLRDYSILEAMAVGSGFGYYSLSSIIITEIHSAELGVIALLSNIMREVITLLLAPVMVLIFGKLAPISSAGATSMDTCLPIIASSSGKGYVLVALFHGILLTVVVPLLVSFILSLN